MTPRILMTVAASTIALAPATARAQVPTSRPELRLSVYVTSDRRTPELGTATSNFEFATAVTLRTLDADAGGLDAGIDLRHTRYTDAQRPDRVSLYDGYVGARLGGNGQFRVRAGHMWLPDLGTAGALAGGMAEYRSGTVKSDHRFRVGGFAGAEPLGYQAGYAPNVRKYGGYAAYERGFLQRHIVGFSTIRNGAVTEREMVSVSNYVPIKRAVFVYQALEYDIKGPAAGAASGGLTYFLVNGRASAGTRVELQGTYNRGRSINARQLADDLANGRPLSARDVEGLRYETAGGRVSVRVARQVQVYAGYARDRNNRDDRPTARTTFGVYAGNLFNTGFDVSGSDARVERATGPYHARYLSVGRRIGRSVYVSGDYSTSLAVVRFVRSDGITIETRPWTHRLSGNGSVILSRQFSLVSLVEYTTDEGLADLRVMSGLTYRLR